MELDKRIKDKSGIQTCISFDKKYIGKKGFFCDEFCQLIDLKAKCCYGTLLDINETDVANDLCFKANSDTTGYNCFFRFFIPEADLKPIEKKYRAYSLEEFYETFDVADLIIFRRQDSGNGTEEHSIYLGYETAPDLITDAPGNGTVLIGNRRYNLQGLFDFYELKINDEWQPFGVIIEEDEE